MSSTVIDRRRLLLGTLTFVGAGSLAAGSLLAGDAKGAVTYVSSARRDDGSYCVVLLDRNGRVLREIPLSARGHDIAIHRPTRRAVAFARRPGTFAVAFELDAPRPPAVFTAAEGRHFYGHGAFSLDGRVLYAAENDIAGARGVIGIYDAEAGYRKIGEHPSYGLGPHELILLADGRTLAVANGGLDTVPDAARQSLNLDNMQPSLTFVDARSGALRSSFALTGETQSLSPRHLVAAADGRVWFGGQWQGLVEASPELIGNVGLDRDLTFLPSESATGPNLKGYVGSMAVSGDGRIIAASSPKAGRVLFVDTQTSRVISKSDLKDACGLAPEGPEGFTASSGFGVLRHETKDAQILSQSEVAGIAFDNHLRRTS